MAQIPAEVLTLVERFDRNREAYQNQAYNETQLRQEFINPLFEALGWDVANKSGYAEAYKEVIHEDAIKIGGATKAPDYCFRIGGARKFFVEAKKPSVSIKENVSPAYQLRRYAWSAKLPLSILTDFEEFAVYDCRLLPKPSDKPSMGRILYLTYNDYADRWDEIETVFSRDAILKGSFDKYAESSKGKRGTAEVDKAFLKEIEAWREALARNLALRNPKLSVRDLNFSVQRTIDRVIFLRMCEDRGIETYGELRSLLNGENTYKRLQYVYGLADDKYNSGLFHFKEEKGRSEEPDKLSLALKIDDKILKDIIRRLYYPESPYEFSVLSADILGNVYEQFLGKVIRLTSGHRAVVEEKPEVKKAGGVYYTPTYIVDYIVNNTVGKLCEDKNPKQLEKLKILDPACGSGSFLIGAYRYLLDYHRDWYVSNAPLKHTKQIFQGPGGQHLLTTQEKKRILLNNIYGVDIDSQAVEVTKLSLLLKVLEGESEETINKQLKIWRERALPDLGHNIKCGNSLIGPEYYERQQASLFNDEETHRVNAFDWMAEFPEIIKAGGFDAVIGNPPYVRIQGFPSDQIDYFSKQYQAAKGNFDLYVNFVEKGFKLLKAHGILGKIIPNKFFRTDYGKGLRNFLSSQRAVAAIVDFGASQVFGATTYTCLLFLCKESHQSYTYVRIKANDEALFNAKSVTDEVNALGKSPWTFANKGTVTILNKMSKGTTRLLDLPADMSRGSSTGDDNVFVIEAGSITIEDEILRQPIFATDFNRYFFSLRSKWRVVFPYRVAEGETRPYSEDELKKRFPKAFRYLLSHQSDLKKRKQYAKWYGFSAPRNLEIHQRAQILVPLLANRGLFAAIPENTQGKLCPMASGGFTVTLSSNCPVKPEYILGLLNSRLLFWRLRQASNLFRGGWITCTKQYFGELPIRNVDFANPEDKRHYNRVVSLVERMLDLRRQLSKTGQNPNDKTRLQREIDTADRQIDQLVYYLYGLTEEEIKIIEKETVK